jgi:hypothetical protein
VVRLAAALAVAVASTALTRAGPLTAAVALVAGRHGAGPQGVLLLLRLPWCCGLPLCRTCQVAGSGGGLLLDGRVQAFGVACRLLLLLVKVANLWPRIKGRQGGDRTREARRAKGQERFDEAPE